MEKPVGFLLLPYGFGQSFVVEGGPFNAYHDDDTGPRYGVCLEERSTKRSKAALKFDIEDFSIPTPEDMDAALAKMINAMYDGKFVYVGCMAGRGRTGLVMSCLAKVFGIKDPIKYVRQFYYKGAVETKAQEDFVNLDFPKARRRLQINRIKHFVGIKRP